jgi:hypothetical protein
MEETERFKLFIQQAKMDNRLTPTHQSLFLALFFCWRESNYQASFKITRKVIMELAKIRSIATYHKCIKEISDHGYIKYLPSFHPLKGSEVRFIIKDL